MTTPIELSSQVGYCAAADVYCTYTEYYGAGTVYGWRHIYIGDQVVRGAGKTKAELVAAGAYAEENVAGAVPADIEIVQAVVELPGPNPETGGEAEPAAVAPEPPAPCCPTACSGSCRCCPSGCSGSCPCCPAAPEKAVAKGPYTVKVVCADFTVEYRSAVSVEVKDAAGKLAFGVN